MADSARLRALVIYNHPTTFSSKYEKHEDALHAAEQVDRGLEHREGVKRYAYWSYGCRDGSVLRITIQPDGQCFRVRARAFSCDS